MRIPALPPQLRLSADGPVATLVVDRPDRLNAFTLQMWAALPEAAAAVEADPEVRVLVIRGPSGGPFSTGADIDEFTTVRREPADAQAYTEVVQRAEAAVSGLSKPVVALIEGWCVGGGCQLALACDVRVAADGASFGITPAKLGIVYPLTSTARLVHTVGHATARFLLMTGEVVDAQRALRMGLVDEVCSPHAVRRRAYALATMLAGRAPISVAGAKALIDRVLAGQESDDAWTRELYAASYHSPEYAEGVAAFGERRVPDFRDCAWPSLGRVEA
ncbi:enoyl-CoA hydratase/isomerase family protein [Hamadaea sp. NPDC051192]|uniref:enoyl-CoA hydratase/isomerase family protein n=1 Tax=Hamadaea sp. NPDC051192 TaxID=3154940 RepID=UPI0034211B4A